jgi:D-arabinose 1-dehydrogenase-like Zn-dependent alcohol dehydrogenase
MLALVFGVEPDSVDPVVDGTPLQRSLAATPMRLQELPDPGFLLPDWVVCRPRLTGICGSDSKPVFMDWGDMSADNPMVDFTSFPHVLGHEVVAEVSALGPEVEGLEIGQRVVLNPWLSCAPRGVTPLCPACKAGDLSLCWSFLEPPIAPGIHSGTSADASGGFATLIPAHDSILFPVPDQVPGDAGARLRRRGARVVCRGGAAGVVSRGRDRRRRPVRGPGFRWHTPAASTSSTTRSPARTRSRSAVGC